MLVGRIFTTKTLVFLRLRKTNVLVSQYRIVAEIILTSLQICRQRPWRNKPAKTRAGLYFQHIFKLSLNAAAVAT